MHVPDGYLDSPTCVATAAIACGGLAVAALHVRRDARPDSARLAGLVAALIFAGQMVNVPVASGTSGHLLGCGIAVAFLGPAMASLVLSVVLAVQCLLFADGGIGALGTNITLMALIGVGSTWSVLAATRSATRSRRAKVAAAGLSAFAAVPIAAITFVALFAVGGSADVELGEVLNSMVGWHMLIGLLEAAWTIAVVGAVTATRPELTFLGSSSTRRAPTPVPA